jgi:uroporphyrinogen-III synthase
MSKIRKSGTSRPLRGVRVLVGRARHQASALSSQLRTLGANVIEIPFIEIRSPRSLEPLNAALRNLAGYDWLILTSVNGVEAMWERARKLKLTQAFTRQGSRIAAIGPATKKAIESHGLKVDVMPKEYVAESVVRSLKKKVKGKRVLLVRARVARDVIPRELRKAGAQVDVVEAYETVVPKASRAHLRVLLQKPETRPRVVTFTSSSTVKNFVELLGGSRAASRMLLAVGGKERPLDTIQFASIGPVTSATLREKGLRVDVEADEYTIPGLVRALVRTAPAWKIDT